MLFFISLATMKTRCLVFFMLSLLSQVNFSLSFSSLSSAPSCFALTQFNNSFSIDSHASLDCDYNLGITSYPKTASWKEGTDCCAWDGVECDSVTRDVITIDLTCSWLSGPFHSNSTLFQLHHLKSLTLAFNHFNYSQIPSEFGKFRSLTHLNLSNSWFDGHVPHEILQLSSLLSLDLSSGFSVPGAFIGCCDLKLDAPDWRGLIGNLTELRELSLNGVDMSFITPSSLMNLSSSLASLSLSGCDMQGEIKDNILSLPNIQTLNLGWNWNLKGYFPRSNWSSSLRFLDLNDVHFSGELPDSISTLKSLESLSLSSCNLTGSVAAALGNLTQLTSLDLSYNNLTGLLPVSVFNSTQLSYLDISSNKLIGPLPNHASGFSYLDLSNNFLNGTLPSWLFTLPSLVTLNFNDNELTGQMYEFQYNQILEYIHLSNNKLHGSIPRSISRVVNLRRILLSSNNFSGVLEFDVFSKLTNLRMLDLHSNLLEGPLPALPPLIRVILISNNKLTGEIPLLTCNASSLEHLDLSHNKLSGMIPQCLGNFSNTLSVLNLRMNRFHGSIPTTFSKLQSLYNLNLNGNQLEGSLPRSLVNCRNLILLDIGNNKLNDTFPHWLGTLPWLRVLVMQSNRFHGSIENPKTEFSFPMLQILDLSHNEFRGLLPEKYFKNFKAMMDLNENHEGYYDYSVMVTMKGNYIELVKIETYFKIIDFSNNSFKGEIPQLIGKLKSLKGLNLSHNKLTGNIPPSLGKLSYLEWLDLSSNKFIGEIPRQLVEIPWLGVLNLSQNQLIGPIPTGKQFNTFNNNSYLENLGLCGFPLSKTCSNHEAQPPPPSTLHEEDDSFGNGFTWKAVLLGCGCGMVFGMFLGYLVFKTGKPKWLVRMVELEQHIMLTRLKKNACRRGGRRN